MSLSLPVGRSGGRGTAVPISSVPRSSPAILIGMENCPVSGHSKPSYEQAASPASGAVSKPGCDQLISYTVRKSNSKDEGTQ